MAGAECGAAARATWVASGFPRSEGRGSKGGAWPRRFSRFVEGRRGNSYARVVARRYELRRPRASCRGVCGGDRRGSCCRVAPRDSSRVEEVARTRESCAAARANPGAKVDAKAPSKEKEGWAFFRLDLADDDHALLAASWGVETAPALLAWLPGKEAPENLSAKITPYNLTKLLKENKPAAAK